MFDDDVLEVPAAERLQKRGGKGNIAQAVCSGPEKPSRTWSSGRLAQVLTQNQVGFYLEEPWTWTRLTCGDRPAHEDNNSGLHGDGCAVQITMVTVDARSSSWLWSTEQFLFDLFSCPHS